MLLVPATKPRSAWRMLVLFFAALLTFGLLTPVTASAHSPTLLRVRDTAVQELDSGYRYVHVKVALNHRVDHKVSVGWYTKAITATPWKDYKPAAGRVVIPKWHRFSFVHVKVYGDTEIEPDEFFKVLLVHPHGARIADQVGIVKIVNDDFPTLPRLWMQTPGSIVEGGLLTVTIRLSEPSTQTVTVVFRTHHGTAVPTLPPAPSRSGDYEPVWRTVTFVPYDTVETVDIQTNDDADTVAETFDVMLKDAVNAKIVDYVDTVTILPKP